MCLYLATVYVAFGIEYEYAIVCESELWAWLKICFVCLLFSQFTWRDFIFLFLNRRKTEQQTATKKKWANYEFLMNAHLIHNIVFVPNLDYTLLKRDRETEGCWSNISICIFWTGIECMYHRQQSFKLYIIIIAHFCRSLVFSIHYYIFNVPVYVRCEAGFSVKIMIMRVIINFSWTFSFVCSEF